MESGIYDKWLESYKSFLLSKSRTENNEESREPIEGELLAVDSYGMNELMSCFIILKYGFLAALGGYLVEALLLKRRQSFRQMKGLLKMLLPFLRKALKLLFKLLGLALCGVFRFCRDVCSEGGEGAEERGDYFDRDEE